MAVTLQLEHLREVGCLLIKGYFILTVGRTTQSNPVTSTRSLFPGLVIFCFVIMACVQLTGWQLDVATVTEVLADSNDSSFCLADTELESDHEQLCSNTTVLSTAKSFLILNLVSSTEWYYHSCEREWRLLSTSR